LVALNSKLVFLLFACAFLLNAQPSGVAERLRKALPDPQVREAALRELTARDYASLQALLKIRATLPGANLAELTAIEASVAFLAGNMSEAIIRFTSAASLAALSDSDLFTWAMAYIKSGDNRHAGPLLSQLSARHPTQALYVYWLGRLDYDQRLYPQAIKRFEQAIALDPKSARIWNALGLAYDMEGQMPQAYDSLSKSAALNRQLAQPSPWPPHDLGNWYLRMNRLREAEGALSEALKYDPALPEAHYHLARTLEKLGRDTEAIAQYKISIANDSSNPDACYALAMLYRRLHREAEASAMLVEYKARKNRS
jgi:tetratricopeptide (TPR) repeat protein